MSQDDEALKAADNIVDEDPAVVTFTSRGPLSTNFGFVELELEPNQKIPPHVRNPEPRLRILKYPPRQRDPLKGYTVPRAIWHAEPRSEVDE